MKKILLLFILLVTNVFCSDQTRELTAEQKIYANLYLKLFKSLTNIKYNYIRSNLLKYTRNLAIKELNTRNELVRLLLSSQEIDKNAFVNQYNNLHREIEGLKKRKEDAISTLNHLENKWA